MNNLYEALELCLQDIEQGADIDTVLSRYPELADQLRPILETSAKAKAIAVSAPSAEQVRRNRARVLQHAAQLREANTRPSQKIWFTPLRRVIVTLAVLIILFVSGTGLVRAASETLPGDNLYPVKRTWEGVQLFLTFNSNARETLESEYANERLYELHELFAEGRSAEVDFRGVVTSQSGNEWVVAGVRVLLSSETEIRDQGIVVGNTVRVRGITQENDTVLAERIRLLDSDDDDSDNSGPGSDNDNSGSDDDNENDDDSNENGSDNDDDNSGPGSGGEDSGDNGNDNEDDDNSGSGSDDNNNNSGGGDNSGPGNSEDDNDNDNSGSDNNDNSGSNSNDDDSDDEDDNSGSGNSDDD